MDAHTLQRLAEALLASQSRLSQLFKAVEDFPDWAPAPERWTFRSIAAHLAAAEAECFLARVQRLKDEPDPTFEYYDNSKRDFGDIEMSFALKHWKIARREVMDLIQEMTSEERRHMGQHTTSGPMGLRELLELMLRHDREHLEEVEDNLKRYRSIQDSGKR